MACKICARSSCCASFHSLKEQEEWDRVYGEVYEKAHAVWRQAEEAKAPPPNEED